MASEKNISNMLLSDYDVIRRLLYDITLRGYRSKGEFDELMFSEDNAEKLLTRLKLYTGLSGYEDVLKYRSGKGGYKYICLNYDPTKMKCNPLDYTWRTAEISPTDAIIWLLLINTIKKGRNTFSKIVEELHTKQDLLGLAEESSEERLWSDKIIRNRLEQLVADGFVNKSGTKYAIARNIFKEFTKKEIEELLEYSEFLQNATPFELPYFLLSKKLKMKHMELSGENTFDIKTDKERPYIICRDHFPATVLSSDVLYAFLRAKKSGEPIAFLWDINNYTIQSKEKWDKKTKSPYYTYSPQIGYVNNISYDCDTGEITVYVKSLTGEDFSGLISDIKLPSERERKEYFEKLLLNIPVKRLNIAFNCLKNDEKRLLSPLAGDFVETLITVWNMMDNMTGGIKIFSNYAFDWNIDFDSNGQLKKLLEYDKKHNTYSRSDIEKIDIIPACIEKEALGNMLIAPFVKAFLSDETQKKLKIQFMDFECSWNINDIEMNNRKEENVLLCNEEFNNLLGYIKTSEYIKFKNNEVVEPVRLEYSIGNNNWRLLVANNAEYRFIQLSNLEGVKGTKEYAIHIGDNEKKMSSRCIDKTIIFRWISGEESLGFFSVVSSKMLNILSAYNHRIEYRKQKGNTELIVSVKVEPEDYDTLINRLQKASAGNFEIII